MQARKILISTLIFCLIGLMIQYYLTNFWIGSKEDYDSIMASNVLLFRAKKALANVIVGSVILLCHWLALKFVIRVETQLRSNYLRVLIIVLILSAIVLPLILL